MKRPTVYFSNQLENLAEALGEELFQGDPFRKKIVFIPSHSLKSYLSFFFARHPEIQISAGVEYKTLLEGVIPFTGEEKGKIPSRIGLSFAIEQELFKMREEGSFEADEKKLVWTAEELSTLFHQYGTFEPEALALWLSKDGWKQSLWKRVFSNGKTYLAKALVDSKGLSTPIHLFGFAHMPSHFFDFFSEFDSKFYFLSPSEMFWEDLCSDKERIYLEKKMIGKKVRLQVQEQMLFLLKDTHPLLANWGRAGRALLARFGEVECYLEERYNLDDPSSVLGFLQKSLLELESLQVEVSLEDTSFLVVSASSKLREIEVLLETLQELMSTNGIGPKDVLVLSSDLEGYLPYIHAVFGGTQSPFSYSVHGLSSSSCSEEVKAIEFFLSLPKTRFTKESVLAFFSLPSVMKKWQFSFKDLTLLEQWLDKAHVLWGFSLEYKEACLARNWPEKAPFLSLEKGGTWAEGLAKLLRSLASGGRSMPEIPFTEAELLGVFIDALHSLEEDLRPIYEEKKLFFSDWTLWVEKWLSTYFESSRVAEALLKDLHGLEKEVEGSLFPISFDSFKRAIDSHFKGKKESFQSGHLNAVKFLPLESGGAHPSRIIYVLGCDEDSFPRSEKLSCFDEASGGREVPSLGDRDRFLFLELILHARDSLVFSYQRVSPQDQKGQNPSRLIDELLSYLDARIVFKGSAVKPSEHFMRHHPALGFSKSYFTGELPWKGGSSSAFNLAKSYFIDEKKEVVPFFPSWQVSSSLSQEEECPRFIEIKKIQDFAKNPLRFYFKERLGIFFDFVAPADKEFFLSPLLKSQLLKEGLQEEGILEEAKDKLPLGELGKLSQEDLLKDWNRLQESFAFFGVQESDFFILEFAEGKKEIEFRGKRIICPPLEVKVGIETIYLVGEIFPICSKGLIWMGKKKKEEYFLLFPSYLIFLCVADKLGFTQESLLIEERKKFPFSIESPRELLSKYITLYQKGFQEPCPISSDLIETLLTEGAESLEKKMTPASYDVGFSDPYEEWTQRRDPSLSYETIHQKWKEIFRGVFAPFVEQKEEEDHGEI